jgi:isopentenyl phosphate kinase
VTFCLDNGLVPVLHGDVAFDTEQDCAILSGDTILEHLSVFLRPERAVFITDVPGVFAEPPPTKSEPGTTPATLLGFVGVDKEDPKRCAESPLLVGGHFEVDEDGARRFVPAADSAETTEEMKRVSNAMRGASMWEFAAENARKVDDASAPDVTGGIATKLRSAAVVAALTNGGVDVFVTDYASGGGHAAIVGDVIVDGPQARRGTLKSSGERWVGTIFGFGR